MAGVREIIDMCKIGKQKEAYQLAKADYDQQQPWAHRTMGWALVYLIRHDAEDGQYGSLETHLDELNSLDKLDDSDSMIFEQAIFWVGYYAKKHLNPKDFSTPTRLSILFSKVNGWTLKPCKGYSVLLGGFIRCDAWQELPDFIDWWNLDNLMPEDYLLVDIGQGRKILSIAERAYIAQSKALLRKNDLGRIEEFLPKMDELMNNHPEMTYPGFFYGKLLLALGSNTDEALKVIVPFAKKKSSEFWVWQLLSDVFTNDADKQLACLVRAVHCRTQENFLGRVRIKLASLYIQRNQLGQAKFQIDKITQSYLSQGWHLPYEVDCWIHQPWINSVTSNDQSPVDYMAITNELLGQKTEEAYAVVTYVDENTHRVSMVCGHEKRLSQKLRFKVRQGDALKITFVENEEGKRKVLHAVKCKLPDNLIYAKRVRGNVKRREGWSYTFFNYEGGNAFVSPSVVSKNIIADGDNMDALIAYDFDKKKDSWNWVVVTVNK